MTCLRFVSSPLPSLCRFLPRRPNFFMKIAYTGFDLPEGKVKYNDAILADLEAMFKPDKVSPFYFELLPDGFEAVNKLEGLLVVSKCNSSSKTGVEMEALLSVTVTALTIYDMCKSIDKSIEITKIRLLSKKGGKSGNYKR